MTTSELRRKFLQALGGGILLAILDRRSVAAEVRRDADSENAWTAGGSNFHAIYDGPALRDRFLQFLQNVFSIVPAEKFHALIAEATRAAAHDREIYLTAQGRLSEVKSIASDVRNALPALLQQTKIIGEQLLQLLDGRKSIDGYMEIGSKGGYIAYAKSRLKLRGDLVLLNTEAASYDLGDIFERRGLFKVGRFIDLNDYAPIGDAGVRPGSLDIVFNPIGFHHSPLARRDDFVRSIRRCLRNGGELIVRDHDVDSTTMNHMVALAHDVFNLGLGHAWESNQREIRNFTSLPELSAYLTRFGFRPTGKAIYQDGDPTRNALMSFVAV